MSEDLHFGLKAEVFRETSNSPADGLIHDSALLNDEPLDSGVEDFAAPRHHVLELVLVRVLLLLLDSHLALGLLLLSLVRAVDAPDPGVENVVFVVVVYGPLVHLEELRATDISAQPEEVAGHLGPLLHGTLFKCLTQLSLQLWKQLRVQFDHLF